ncbi:TerD family protein [Streptomyces hoynatensis]|uniref:TerD-family protein n=1 Tax=Streptomyces hoynatensis TaxID=1141874 RepID=A0A3A9YVQ7_9ACTN|nr:TerD family protein [Streptomyces hoynatensis]RKN40085.1 TerD-family protein [Streptomyces hoynatensis]
MSGPTKGIGRAQVMLKWDPSPLGEPADDLDIIAATYRAEAPYGEPAYLVHFDSRSPDGTITLSRDSRNGQGFGYDEVMLFELDRLAAAYSRVVVGVVIQQENGPRTFGQVANTQFRVLEGQYTVLAEDDFADVSGCTAATVAEFRRNEAGAWSFRKDIRGFHADPTAFTTMMAGEPG